MMKHGSGDSDDDDDGDGCSVGENRKPLRENEQNMTRFSSKLAIEEWI